MAAYAYVEDLEPWENQYDYEYDLTETRIVEARYVRNRLYPGNRYIEALPPRITEEECVNKYTRAVTVPSRRELQTVEKEELIASVDVLDDFRALLPFHITLEREFRRALERSYKRRQVISDKGIQNTLSVNGRPFVTHQAMHIREQSNAVPGFTLLGMSGCGKTTGINTLVMRYPQTIIHDPGKFTQCTQIVYLIVECPNNNGFAQLYRNIGKAIDRALGNFNHAYERLLSVHTTLGALNAKVAELIELFSIGIIIFDEIELIDLKTTRESSVESLLLLANDTGVAIAVVGTQDAYNDLFSKRRTARRTGVLIPASLYCTRKEQFKAILEDLCMFQWTVNPITFSDDVINELYRCTDGVISDLVEIYKLIQVELILGRPVTRKSIRIIVNKYYKGLQKAKTVEVNLLDTERSRHVMDEILNFNSPAEIEEAAYAEQMYEEVMGGHAYMIYARLKETVVREILNTEPGYRKSEIEFAFDVIMTKEDLRQITLTNATVKTLTFLRRRKGRARKTAEERKRYAIRAQSDLAENDRLQKEDHPEFL